MASTSGRGDEHLVAEDRTDQAADDLGQAARVDTEGPQPAGAPITEAGTTTSSGQLAVHIARHDSAPAT